MIETYRGGYIKALIDVLNLYEMMCAHIKKPTERKILFTEILRRIVQDHRVDDFMDYGINGIKFSYRIEKRKIVHFKWK